MCNHNHGFMNKNHGENKFEDQNKIYLIEFMQYFLKSFKLIIVISNCCFFVGIIWYIFCECELDFKFKF